MSVDHVQTRRATEADLPPLESLMQRAIALLQRGFLDARQIQASRAIMGLDTQLIRDRTYLVAVREGMIVGCGGWSRRATLFGGDLPPGAVQHCSIPRRTRPVSVPCIPTPTMPAAASAG